MYGVTDFDGRALIAGLGRSWSLARSALVLNLPGVLNRGTRVSAHT